MITHQEGLSLLRKWHDENTLLTILVFPSAGLFQVRVMGFIAVLDSDSIMIGDRSYVAVNPTACRAFYYLETKDIKDEPEALRQSIAERQGIATLTMVLGDKTEIHISEAG